MCVNEHIYRFDLNIQFHLYVACVSLYRQLSSAKTKAPECHSCLRNSVKEVPELCSSMHHHKNSGMYTYICIDMYKYKVTQHEYRSGIGKHMFSQTSILASPCASEGAHRQSPNTLTQTHRTLNRAVPL